MPMIYFHLRDGTDIALDLEGRDIPLEELDGLMLVDARTIISHDALDGRIDLRMRIDAEDDCGQVLRSLFLADAVEIIPRD